MNTLFLAMKQRWFVTLFSFFTLMFSLMLYLLPNYAEQYTRDALSEAGYTQIEMAPMSWSSSGLGLEFASLQASGAHLPKLDLGATDVWFEVGRLWNGALGFRVRSALLAGDFEVRVWHQIWSEHGNAEVRLDGIKIAEVMATILNLAEMIPFFADKSLDGQLWLAATTKWDKLEFLDIPITLNASLAGVSLLHDDKTPLLQAEKLRFIDVVYQPQQSVGFSVLATGFEASKLYARNAGLNKAIDAFPLVAEGLHIKGLNFSETQQLNVSEIALNGMSVGEGKLTVAELETVGLTHLELKPQQVLNIDNIRLEKGQLFALKAKEGQTTPLDLLLVSLPKSEPEKDVSGNQPGQSKPLAVVIKNIEIQTVEVTLTDANFARDKVMKASIRVAELKDVNLQQAEQPMHWRIQGSFGENGAWFSDGSIWLDDVEREVETTLTINALELAPYSGYLERQFGSGIQSGNMDVQFQAQVLAGDVDVSGTLLARKVSLKASDSFLDVGKDWSLSSAVDVLRDSDNNIKLEIEAKGKLDDPDFKLSGIWDKVLKEAVQSTTISYLAQTMQPYGLAYTLGQYLYEQSKTIELKPFVFETGGATLTAKSPDWDGYSEKIAGLLKKKTTYILEICPRFVAAETDDQEALSLQRVQSLTQRLQALALEPRRWTVCEPKLDERKQATSRLTMRLL